MVLNFRTILLITLSFLVIFFLYLARSILAPFIIAAIFAYIFNPVVNFLSQKIRLPRGLSVIFIYLAFISLLGYLGIIIAGRLVSESEELILTSRAFLGEAEKQIATLPPPLPEIIREPVRSFQTTIIKPGSVLPFFSGAITGFVDIFIFLFSAFFLLKEGGKIFDRLSLLAPPDYRIEVAILLRKINSVLGRYLRGQLLLILIMSVCYFVILSILGVRSALLIALVGGLLEIIPMIGPVIAGLIAVLVAVFDGVSRLGLSTLYEGVIVAATYFVLNQVESYLIVPTLIGKLTKLHPLVIVLAVLVGGANFGILGIILAVPTVATLRILLEYGFDKLTPR